MTTTTSGASFGSHEFDVELAASTSETWKHLIVSINHWWTDDFRMLGPTSTVELDVAPGGKGLVETTCDGELLQWYAVQAYFPSKHKLYLAGHLAADYGGPRTSLVRIRCESTESESAEDTSTCRLVFQDSQIGNLTSRELDTMASEWTRLFTDGFKPFVEQHGS